MFFLVLLFWLEWFHVGFVSDEFCEKRDKCVDCPPRCTCTYQRCYAALANQFPWLLCTASLIPSAPCSHPDCAIPRFSCPWNEDQLYSFIPGFSVVGPSFPFQSLFLQPRAILSSLGFSARVNALPLLSSQISFGVHWAFIVFSVEHRAWHRVDARINKYYTFLPPE